MSKIPCQCPADYEHWHTDSWEDVEEALYQGSYVLDRDEDYVIQVLPCGSGPTPGGVPYGCDHDPGGNTRTIGYSRHKDSACLAWYCADVDDELPNFRIALPPIRPVSEEEVAEAIASIRTSI